MIIRTYYSENAADRLRWLAFIDNGGRDYLPVRFSGATEDEARSNAQAEWDKHEKERRERESRKADAALARARKSKNV